MNPIILYLIIGLYEICMMDTMIKENGVTFKDLEKNIFHWICQIVQKFTKEFLERYDQ